MNKVTIDVSGPQGNAFALLGMARSIAAQLGWTKEAIEALLERMQADDYDELVAVMDEELGEHIKFIGRR